jgi:hypothetical protein
MAFGPGKGSTGRVRFFGSGTNAEKDRSSGSGNNGGSGGSSGTTPDLYNVTFRAVDAATGTVTAEDYATFDVN